MGGIPWMYCRRRPTRRYQVLWEPGSLSSGLLHVHRGKVALYSALPTEGEKWGAPLAVFGRGWFLNSEFLTRQPTRHFALALSDGVLLAWDREAWSGMCLECPLVCTEILKATMKQLVQRDQTPPPQTD